MKVGLRHHDLDHHLDPDHDHVNAGDFQTGPEGGVLRRRESMKRYFTAYEKELTAPIALGEESLSFRQVFRRQAERLARALTTDEPYEPFELPC